MGIWAHGGVSHVVSVFEKGCKKVSWCVGLGEHFSAWLANDFFYKKKVLTIPSGCLCSCFRTTPVSTRISICFFGHIHLPPFFGCGTVQGPPSGHFSPLSLPRTSRTTGAVRGIIPPRDCPSPALPPRALATLSTKKKVSFGERTRNCVTCFTEGKKHPPTPPPTQPATLTHTQHTHTHPPTHTNTLANKHTDTQPQNHHHCSRDLFLRYQMPDARCQINRSTD